MAYRRVAWDPERSWEPPLTERYERPIANDELSSDADALEVAGLSEQRGQGEVVRPGLEFPGRPRNPGKVTALKLTGLGTVLGQPLLAQLEVRHGPLDPLPERRRVVWLQQVR